MLTQEKINANFVTYCNKLEKYGCYSEEMMKAIGDGIKNCPFGMSEDGGGAYQGGMVDVVLHNLCKLAHNINEYGFGGEKTNHPLLKVNCNMLFKVLLLQHIAKAEMFVCTREQWKIKKGIFYDFNETLKSKLKLGERSIYLCQKYGIKLEEEEYEAMRSIDKTDENKGEVFCSPLCILVKFVNTLAAVELKRKYISENSPTEL